MTAATPGGVSFEWSVAPPPRPFSTDVPLFLAWIDGESVGLDPEPMLALPDLFRLHPSVLPGSQLAMAVQGFFDNGGQRAFVGVAGDVSSATKPAGMPDELLSQLQERDDIDLVAMPGVTALTAQTWLLEGAAGDGGRLLLLDPWDDPGAQAAALGNLPGAALAAIYAPSIKVVSGGSLVTVPPCGHVAGTMARVGPGAAPANLPLVGALDIGPGSLANDGVNPIVAVRGRGVRAQGARTLAPGPWGDDVGVTCLAITIVRWVRSRLSTLCFEPQGPRTQAQVQRQVTEFMTHLYERQWLRGSSPAEAFAVTCDETNNPPADRELGQMVVDVWLVPTRALRAISLRFIQGHDGVAVTS